MYSCSIAINTCIQVSKVYIIKIIQHKLSFLTPHNSQCKWHEIRNSIHISVISIDSSFLSSPTNTPPRSAAARIFDTLWALLVPSMNIRQYLTMMILNTSNLACTVVFFVTFIITSPTTRSHGHSYNRHTRSDDSGCNRWRCCRKSRNHFCGCCFGRLS